MGRMKVVGHRKDRPSRLLDAAPLQRLAIGLRPTPFLVPRGVYRFRSFEEADRWMIETMARTFVSLSSTTSSAPAGR
jgi:hypothetical protein